MDFDKPTTAQGYTAGQTEACERALVTLLRGFGTFKSSLRLVGGLVPRYLTPEQPPDVPAHAGTRDVDVWLNIQVLAKSEAYKTLGSQLKARGFERFVNDDGKASSWRWRFKAAEHSHVLVEFLCDPADDAPGGMVSSVEDEKISALGIKHSGIVEHWFEEREVTAALLDETGIATETVRYADAVAFIILKSIAFADRAEGKDAADLAHVMRYAGGPDQLAARFSERYFQGQHRNAIDESRMALRRSFCDGNGVEGHERDGPIKAGIFKFGESPAPDLANAVMRERRDVAGIVNAFLQALDHAIGPASTS